LPLLESCWRATLKVRERSRMYMVLSCWTLSPALDWAGVGAGAVEMSGCQKCPDSKPLMAAPCWLSLLIHPFVHFLYFHSDVV
jgi:hypothetical protein